MTSYARTAFAVVTAVAICWASATAADIKDFPAKGWTASGSAPQDYEFGTAHIDGVPGNCAFIKAKAATPSGFGTLAQVVAADNYHDQRLRLSALIKTDNATDVQVWMRVDGRERKMLGFYNMDDKPIRGTTDWKRYEVVLDVPSEAIDIAFGYFLNGSGTAWAREFKLESVGKDVPVSSELPPQSPANMNFDQ